MHASQCTVRFSHTFSLQRHECLHARTHLPHSLHSRNDDTLSVLVLRRHHYNHTLVFGELGVRLRDVSTNKKVRDWYQRRLLPWTDEEVLLTVCGVPPCAPPLCGLQAIWVAMEAVWTPVNYVDDDDACRMEVGWWPW